MRASPLVVAALAAACLAAVPLARSSAPPTVVAKVVAAPRSRALPSNVGGDGFAEDRLHSKRLPGRLTNQNPG